MMNLIVEFRRNRSFTLTTGCGLKSRLQCVENGVPYRSVFAPLLFNMYTYDLPTNTGKKIAYADDLAIMHFTKNWKALKEVLKRDMTTVT